MSKTRIVWLISGIVCILGFIIFCIGILLRYNGPESYEDAGNAVIATGGIIMLLGALVFFVIRIGRTVLGTAKEIDDRFNKK